jgi:hypothetical protein
MPGLGIISAAVFALGVVAWRMDRIRRIKGSKKSGKGSGGNGKGGGGGR